jgi:hypothetical protein
VQKSQNAPPVFQPDLYTVSIDENYIPSEPLVRLQVVTESIITVFTILLEGEFSNHFQVTENGSLFLTLPVDYEATKSVTVKISVSDGVLESFQPASVLIEINPVNDNSPNFEVSHQTLQVEENLPQNTMEVILLATDADVDNRQTRHGVVISYELLTEDVPFLLLFNPTAVITNSRPLDAEQDQALYTLRVMAYDGEGTPSKIPTEVIVQVVDVDDNVPQFQKSSYHTNIEENYQGEVIAVTAVDMDRDPENSRVSYELMGNTSGPFQILSHGSIINTMIFDYEEDESYFVLNVQTIGCNVPQCQTTVNISVTDRNDNYPKFSRANYYFNISADVIPSIGYVIGYVIATDADKSERYGTVRDYRVRGTSGPFSVHATTGNIVVHNPYELQQIEGIFSFDIMARDSGSRYATTSAHIHVPLFNVHPPIFERRLYYTSWEENTFRIALPGLPANAILRVQAQDLDKRTDITYSLTEPSQYFQLLSSGVLILKEPLDWEEHHEHIVFARASDGKFNSTFDTEIRIIVIDQNDNSPSFSSDVYYMNVSEFFNTLVSPIGQIFAKDDDSPGTGFHFSTIGESSPITIDSVGYVFLTMQLDYEKISQYAISIKVSDGEHQSLLQAQVILNVIDENDHYPHFDQPVHHGRFPENAPPGTLLIPISANDMDITYGNIVRYEILNIGLPFLIEPLDNGSAAISNSHSMDYETDKHIFVLQVHAFDNGGLRSMFPAQVTITLEDVDDCGPRFSQSVYYANVKENNRVALFITSILAYDRDASLAFRGIRYTIVNQQQGVVNIDPTSGSVTAARSFDFESSQNPVLIEVRAISSSNISKYDTATLNLHILDLNEYNPEFLGLPYYVAISETTGINRPVFEVEAFDQDGGEVYGTILRYWMLQSSTNSLPFRLDGNSGELYLTRTLNYENGDRRFDFSLVAIDGGSYLTKSSIEVSIINENDEEPYFTGTSVHNVSIQEEVFPLHLPGLPENAFLQVGAFDDDLLEDSYLHYNLSSYDIFSIDSSGYLYLTTPLDFEMREQYQVLINVSDGMFMARTTVSVIVYVQNRNDNPPLFHKCLDGCCGLHHPAPFKQLNVEENSIPHAPLSTFSACDVDGDSLEYYILNSTNSGFEIKGSDLYLSRELDYEEVSVIDIYIGCFDGKYNSTNFVRVELLINNVDDNILAFETEYYEASVKEDIIPGGLNISISAMDKDLPMLDIQYNIQAVDGLHFPFEIVKTESNGHILTNVDSLDFESGGEMFLFNITAQPTSPIERAAEPAVATIKIAVLDINEYSPEFSSSMYASTFPENMVGVLANISAQDRDAGNVFGDISYNIVYSPTLTCTINKNGELMNEYPLDADIESPMHHILVEAVDVED